MEKYLLWSLPPKKSECKCRQKFVWQHLWIFSCEMSVDRKSGSLGECWVLYDTVRVQHKAARTAHTGNLSSRTCRRALEVRGMRAFVAENTTRGATGILFIMYVFQMHVYAVSLLTSGKGGGNVSSSAVRLVFCEGYWTLYERRVLTIWVEMRSNRDSNSEYKSFGQSSISILLYGGCFCRDLPQNSRQKTASVQ